MNGSKIFESRKAQEEVRLNHCNEESVGSELIFSYTPYSKQYYGIIIHPGPTEKSLKGFITWLINLQILNFSLNYIPFGGRFRHLLTV